MDRRVEGPRFLRPDEFPEAIDLVRRCFGMDRDDDDAPPPHWADPHDPDRHAVVTVDGEVVSHAVCAPVEFQAGPARVAARGIAGVATDPAHRGNGYMTQLIEFWIDHANSTGVPLLELEGDRQRYMRFGWDNAGAEFRFEITPRSHPAPVDDADPIRRFRPDSPDLEFVATLHDDEPYQVLRDLDRYERVLDPYRYETVLYETTNQRAYVSYRGEDPVTVAEFGGSRAGVSALLGHLCATIGDLHLYTHPNHPLVDLCYEVSADWVLRSHRKLRITDLYDVLTAYRPLIAARWRNGLHGGHGSVALALEDEPPVRLRFDGDSVEIDRVDGPPAVELDRPAMTRLLFGVSDGMWPVKRSNPVLEAVLPLEYYMWQTETI